MRILCWVGIEWEEVRRVSWRGLNGLWIGGGGPRMSALDYVTPGAPGTGRTGRTTV